MIAILENGENTLFLNATDRKNKKWTYSKLLYFYTTQGLEFDYVGVIIGDDMRYENGHVVTDFTKRAKTDQSLKGIKKMFKENPDKARKRADEIIKNTYRTLLTRGMKGCYIYCTDPGLREYIRSRLDVASKAPFHFA